MINMTAGLILEYLDDNYHIEHSTEKTDFEVSLPVLGIIPAGSSNLFVCPDDIPCTRYDKQSMVICFSKEEFLKHRQDPALIVFVQSGEPLAVFNALLDFISRIISWETHLLKLMTRHATIKDLMEASIPVFENRISVVDSNLRVICFCAFNSAAGRVEINHNYDNVPSSIVSEFYQSYHLLTMKKQPFVYVEKKGNKRIDNYCINFFLRSNYIGSCALSSDFRPIRKYDYSLFRIFSEFVQHTIKAQKTLSNDSFVTERSIFKDLLENRVVSDDALTFSIKRMKKECRLADSEAIFWRCIYIQSIKKDSVELSEYLCDATEKAVRHSIAVEYNDGIAVLFMAGHPEDFTPILNDLKRLLDDFYLTAIAGEPFTDLYLIRKQAAMLYSILNNEKISHPTNLIYQKDVFVPHIISLIKESVPEDVLLTEGMSQLRKISTTTDYWQTLRVFLENECNATKTAKDLYIHRSTLLGRLEVIKKYVDLSSPDARFYAEVCTKV